MAEQMISARLSTYSYSGITLHSPTELPLAFLLTKQLPRYLDITSRISTSVRALSDTPVIDTSYTKVYPVS